MQVLSLLLVATFATQSMGLNAKWTPADDEAPLPLSKKYRDKLDELEAKVGPEKFQELTGMTPPSQSAGRASTSTSQAKISLEMIANLLIPRTFRSWVCILVGVIAAALGYSAIGHCERTGFRVPVSFLTLLLPLLDGHASRAVSSLGLKSMEWGSVHASLQPPPPRHIKDWVRALGVTQKRDEESTSIAILGEDIYNDRVFLGRGPACHRTARESLKNLRICSFGDDDMVEVTVVDSTLHVGVLARSPKSDDNVSGEGRTLWWLTPMSVVAQDSAWVPPTEGRANVGGRVRRDSVVLAAVNDAASPPWWRGGCTLTLSVEFHEESEDVFFFAHASSTNGEPDNACEEMRLLVVAALKRSMKRGAKQEERVRLARERSHSKYQGQADKALAAKRTSQRDLVIERGDVRANLRFRGGALEDSPRRSFPVRLRALKRGWKV